MVTGSKGDPAANRHLPLLHVYASKADLSLARGIGERKTIGFPMCSHSNSMCSRVKTGPKPDNPKSACGLTRAMSSARSSHGAWPICANFFLFGETVEIFSLIGDQTFAVHEPDGLLGFVFAQTLAHQQVHDLRRHADGGGTGAEKKMMRASFAGVLGTEAR